LGKKYNRKYGEKGNIYKQDKDENRAMPYIIFSSLSLSLLPSIRLEK
jgi:hypothetical protein